LNKKESEELSGYTEIGTFTKIMDEKRFSAVQEEDETVKRQRDFIRKKELERLNFFQRTWRKFDDKVMKPIFVEKGTTAYYPQSNRNSEAKRDEQIHRSISLTEMRHSNSKK
jgi:hypothetical protein